MKDINGLNEGGGVEESAKCSEKVRDPSLVAEAVAWKSRCKWKLLATSCPTNASNNQYRNVNDPHTHVTNDLSHIKNKIHDSIVSCIGITPVVRLNNLAKLYNLECELLAKCEYLNPGGSVKDRIAARMVDDAERRGIISPHSGYTIIEPTSGNTGIGLAMVCAVRGYWCIIVMPEKMSAEKENILKLLGAQIIRTKTDAAYNDKNSHISKCIELHKQIPKSIILNQYRASGNPMAHYDTTAEEILKATNNELDLVVMGTGTGGTLTGVARKLKERIPLCKICGIDPVGSILAEPEKLNEPVDNLFYEVEGIGYDFVPTVLDRSIVDVWYKTNDKDSFLMSRQLIKTEGLLVGGSSGSAVFGAIQAIKDLGLNEANKRVLVLLPDGIKNYMSKFIDDEWMKARNFL